MAAKSDERRVLWEILVTTTTTGRNCEEMFSVTVNWFSSCLREDDGSLRKPVGDF
jgi:hypothetical protein